MGSRDRPGRLASGAHTEWRRGKGYSWSAILRGSHRGWGGVLQVGYHQGLPQRGGEVGYTWSAILRGSYRVEEEWDTPGQLSSGAPTEWRRSGMHLVRYPQGLLQKRGGGWYPWSAFLRGSHSGEEEWDTTGRLSTGAPTERRRGIHLFGYPQGLQWDKMRGDISRGGGKGGVWGLAIFRGSYRMK